MSEAGPDSLVLRYLQRIDENVSRMGEDPRDPKVRVTSLEEAVVGTNRRLDRIEARVERIERRLDLADALR